MIQPTDPGSLQRLHDIVAAPPAPWWPPAPGWIVVAVGAVIFLTVALWQAVAWWQRNRYRREAMSLLAQLEADRNRSLSAVAELVKRTALTAFPRIEVASLAGEPWLSFLDYTGGNHAFTHGPGRLLVQVPYAPTTITDGEREQLFQTVRHWLRNHSALENPMGT